MKYKLYVSELAHQDLDKIVSYIAVQLANPIAAREFLNEVDKCYGFLKGNPWMYSRCQDQRLSNKGYRKIVIKNYIIVYKIDKESGIVSILRFFYGGQEYIEQL